MADVQDFDDATSVIFYRRQDMIMNRTMKKILPIAVAIVLVVVVLILLMKDGTKHIEDTNGSDDYTLQTITDENIINMDVGAIGGPRISTDILSGDAVEFSADKFTGVYEILYDNYILKSDFDLHISSFVVNEGNFKLVVVHNDEIVATLEPDLFVDYRLEDITGTVSLRIAGESASFSFSMTQYDYDSHAHADLNPLNNSRVRSTVHMRLWRNWQTRWI